MRRSAAVRSLIAISAPTQPSRSRLLLRLLEADIRLFGVRQHALKAIRSLQLTTINSLRVSIRGYVDVPTRTASRSSLANAIRSFVIDRSDVTQRLAQIRVPSLFLATEDRRDWTPLMADAAARRVHTARVVSIPGSRTQAQIESPQLTAQIVVAQWTTLSAGLAG